MTFSPFDHPFLGGYLGDEEIAGYFSAEADIRAMLAFETALAEAQAEAGLVPASAAARIRAAAENFQPDLDALRIAVSRDSVVVPDLVRQLREAVGVDAAPYVHFGSTTQDVVDTSLMLRLRPVLAILSARLGVLLDVFGQLADRDGDRVLMGHTRMQAAITITSGARVSTWRGPMERDRARLDAFSAAGLPVQFGGAAGTLEKFDAGAVVAIRARLARRLDLVDVPQWHAQRDRVVELAGLLSLVTGSLGKFGKDVALLAQAGGEISLAGGGGSSAMPHKQNPVAAEMLVTLARFNATQVAGMHHALVHEQERSGAAWTLEWLLFPQMVCATASALRLAVDLAGSIRRLGRA